VLWLFGVQVACVQVPLFQNPVCVHEPEVQVPTVCDVHLPAVQVPRLLVQLVLLVYCDLEHVPSLVQDDCVVSPEIEHVPLAVHELCVVRLEIEQLPPAVHVLCVV
jgi:hypothetical protein